MQLITTFPDHEMLFQLLRHHEEKVAAYQCDFPLRRLLMLCGAVMNWIGDLMTDPNVRWTQEKLSVDDLTLSGTFPAWDAVILHQCERSPAKLGQLIHSDPQVTAMFQDAVFHDMPILVCIEDRKQKVLDGMHRVIAAIRDRRETIRAYVARIEGTARPSIEPHVVYDLLRAYQRGINRDRDDLVAGLRFLRKAYANVEDLLRDYFTEVWADNDDMRSVVVDALQG